MKQVPTNPPLKIGEHKHLCLGPECWRFQINQLAQQARLTCRPHPQRWNTLPDRFRRQSNCTVWGITPHASFPRHGEQETAGA